MDTCAIYGKGIAGRGQTKSFTLSGQNSRILLWRYHWRSSDKPGGIICSGKFNLLGCHEMSFISLIFLSVSSLEFLTNTWPGWSDVNLKWCIFEIPFKDVWMTWCSKKTAPVIHLYIGGSIILCHQLGVVHRSGTSNHLSNITDTSHLCPSVQLLKKTKAPIWGKFRVPHQKK